MVSTSRAPLSTSSCEYTSRNPVTRVTWPFQPVKNITLPASSPVSTNSMALVPFHPEGASAIRIQVGVVLKFNTSREIQTPRFWLSYARNPMQNMLV